MGCDRAPTPRRALNEVKQLTTLGVTIAWATPYVLLQPTWAKNDKLLVHRTTPGERKTFGLVGIQQGVWGRTQHLCQFPAKIVGILDAGIQPCPPAAE